ncbi:MAG: hypothetical protein RJQ21_12340 [Rhodospirillales bacterium]
MAAVLAAGADLTVSVLVAGFSVAILELPDLNVHAATQQNYASHKNLSIQ